jgi:hypothetical protein
MRKGLDEEIQHTKRRDRHAACETAEACADIDIYITDIATDTIYQVCI